jgi:hypothetical protein
MKIKMRKVLTDRQMIKAKYITAVGTLLCIGLLSRDFLVSAEEDDVFFEYDGEKEFRSYGNETMSKGTIHYFGYN